MSLSIFTGLSQAKVSESGVYLPPNGRFKLEILKCQLVHPRDGSAAFVVDFKVLESSISDVKPGETRNWYQKNNDSFLSAILEFLAAAFGFNCNDPAHKAQMEAQLKPQAELYAEAAVGDQQLLKGKLIKVETQKRDTRAGGEFTRHVWLPVT